MVANSIGHYALGCLTATAAELQDVCFPDERLLCVPVPVQCSQRRGTARNLGRAAKLSRFVPRGVGGGVVVDAN